MTTAEESPQKKRFAVALSFPGEHRAFVEAVAKQLATKFGRERVLYDQFHEDDFAQPDLDVYLPGLYRKESELVVIFLCPEYAAKRWCRLEWRHIRQLISTVESKRIMFCNFAEGSLPEELGILSGDGYLVIGQREPADIATLILKRYARLNGLSFAEAKPAVAPINRLLPPVADFTERKGKLKELREKAAKGSVQISGVRGMGGAGKTELARKYAQELAATYKDAQIEVDLKGVSAKPLTPEEVLEKILRVFVPEAKLPEGVAELRAALRQVLNGKRVLLLLDNSKDGQQIAPVLPPPAGCFVLVTSRFHFAVPGMETVDLNTMEPDEARKMLRKIHAGVNAAEADQLAELCGRLPLALRLAASYLKERADVTTADYLQQLAASRDRVGKLDGAKDYTAEQLGLAASFTLSYEQLKPEQQKLFCQLAVFPDTFDGAALQAVWGLDADATGDAVGVLMRLSLLEWLAAEKRYDLHDLLRDFAQTHAKKGELDVVIVRHAQHFIFVAKEARKRYELGNEGVLSGLQLFDREFAHISAAFERLKNSRNKKTAALLITLVDAVVYTSALRFHPREHIAWLEAQRGTAQFIGHRKAEASSLGNLGNAYMNLSETRKAIGFYEQALTIDREIGDRCGEGVVLGNLGVAYKNLGAVRKAMRFFEQQLEITREIGDRRGEGNALSNFGIAYMNLSETRKAIGLHEQALTIAREIGDRRGEANDLGNLGVAYKNLGETRTAIGYLEQQLVIAREIGDRRGEGNALGNLGNANADLGETRTAIGFYEQALTIDREIGNRHGEGNALGSLGLAYKNLGDKRKAVGFFEQQLVIAREVGDRRGEGNALGSLGIAYADLSDTRKAIVSFDQQLVIAREIGDRRGEGIALFNSVQTLAQMGQWTEAVERAEAALEIFEAIEDPHASQVRAALAAWRKQK